MGKQSRCYKPPTKRNTQSWLFGPPFWSSKKVVIELLFRYRFISLLFSRAKKVAKKPALCIIRLPIVALCKKFEKLRSLKTGNVKQFQICFSISAHGSQANDTRRIFRSYFRIYFLKKKIIPVYLGSMGEVRKRKQAKDSKSPMKKKMPLEHLRPYVQRFFIFWTGKRV